MQLAQERDELLARESQMVLGIGRGRTFIWFYLARKVWAARAGQSVTLARTCA